jgi:hypothetical protein
MMLFYRRGWNPVESLTNRGKIVLLLAHFFADVHLDQRKWLKIKDVPAKGPNNAVEESINGSDF